MAVTHHLRFDRRPVDQPARCLARGRRCLLDRRSTPGERALRSGPAATGRDDYRHKPAAVQRPNARPRIWRRTALVAGEVAYLSNFADQRLYRIAPREPPPPLPPAPPDHEEADATLPDAE